MDQHFRQTAEVSMPTARRVAVRTLPVATVMAAGLPLVLRVQLLDVTGESRSHWWLAALLALSGLGLLVHHDARAPRPRLAPRVSRAQLNSALVSAARTGTVPQDPDVRITAGVIACRGVEAQVGAAATAVGMILSALVLPGVPWFAVLGGVTVVALMAALQARHSWVYLQALHAAGRTA